MTAVASILILAAMLLASYGLAKFIGWVRITRQLERERQNDYKIPVHNDPFERTPPAWMTRHHKP